MTWAGSVAHEVCFHPLGCVKVVHAGPECSEHVSRKLPARGPSEAMSASV